MKRRPAVPVRAALPLAPAALSLAPVLAAAQDDGPVLAGGAAGVAPVVAAFDVVVPVVVAVLAPPVGSVPAAPVGPVPAPPVVAAVAAADEPVVFLFVNMKRMLVL